jgi:HSP20 family protein
MEVDMLTRFDPFREMVSMRRMMDRLIDEGFTGDGDTTMADWALPLDVVEQNDQFVVKASLPGVKLDDIDVTFNNGVLTIKGEIKEDIEHKADQYHLRERRWGSFSRSVSLPSTIQADGIQAEYQDGILVLHLPKSEAMKPKRIAITQGKKMIDSKTK